MGDGGMTANPDTPMGWRAEIGAQPIPIGGGDRHHLVMQMLGDHYHHGDPCRDSGLPKSAECHCISFKDRHEKRLRVLLKLAHPFVITFATDAFYPSAIWIARPRLHDLFRTSRVYLFKGRSVPIKVPWDVISEPIRPHVLFRDAERATENAAARGPKIWAVREFGHILIRWNEECAVSFLQSSTGIPNLMRLEKDIRWLRVLPARGSGAGEEW